jgi:DNA transposition AAA+ family ATPase
MNAKELRKLLETNELSQSAAARELGMDPRSMRRYIAGDAPIPKVVELALRFLITDRKTKVKS